MSSRKIPKRIEKSIQSYVRVLKEDDLPITQVSLFGSYAKGKARASSDIDLCVISPKFKDPWAALQYLWSKRISDEGTTIEPIGFSPQDFAEESPLINEVKRYGIKIPTTLPKRPASG